MEHSIYKIVRNSNDRRILVINQYVDVENSEELQEDKFDIVYLNITNMSNNEFGLLLEKTSPIFSTKCWMKPRFVQANTSERLGMLRIVVDGVANSPFDDIVTQRSEEIFAQMERLEIKQVANVSTYVAFFIRLCKYSISRNRYTYTSSVIPGLSEGHSAIYAAMLSNNQVATRKEFLEFNQKMIDMGYAEPQEFVERVHLCPNCKNSHLIYAECCPKCDSSNVNEEPMLHHFRCANISPESTYVYDDKLRCPKCRQYLHHIGVDYDRPTDVHTCGDCGHTFIHTKMKVRCTQCGSIHRPSQLHHINVVRYQYTPEGIHSIINNDALIKIGKDLWFGYSNFNSYLEQLRLFSHTSAHNETLYTIRLKMHISESMNEAERLHFLTRMHEVFYNYNFSYKGDYYFLSSKNTTEEFNDTQQSIEWNIMTKISSVQEECPFVSVLEQSMVVRGTDENIEKYIRRLCEPIFS
jgi:rubrerythrin